jgi:hypothetical protein
MTVSLYSTKIHKLTLWKSIFTMQVGLELLYTFFNFSFGVRSREITNLTGWKSEKIFSSAIFAPKLVRKFLNKNPVDSMQMITVGCLLRGF